MTKIPLLNHVTIPGPDLSTVTEISQETQYLNPKDIVKLGLNDWVLVRITGHYHDKEKGEAVRIFFRPLDNAWKSAVERPQADWAKLLEVLRCNKLKELNDKRVYVKLAEHDCKTDITAIARPREVSNEERY